MPRRSHNSTRLQYRTLATATEPPASSRVHFSERNRALPTALQTIHDALLNYGSEYDDSGAYEQFKLLRALLEGST